MHKLILIFALMLVSDENQLSGKLRNGISVSSAQDACSGCVCGLLGKGRIKEGYEVDPIKKYPWMSRLNIGEKKFCGGSLINSKYIVTAAHCVYQKSACDIVVRLMEHDITVEDETDIIKRGVANVIIHPSFDPTSKDNDIALLNLDQPVQMGAYRGMPNPICLTHGDKSRGAFPEAIVIGWGLTAPNTTLSPVLKEIDLPIISNSDCNIIYSNVTSNMICAGFPQDNTGPLQGDSGGPLMAVENLKYALIGVVSKGVPTSGTTVFTRVSQYLDWIAENTAGACYCTN